jgi:alpha-N-arabinofuranosidase
MQHHIFECSTEMVFIPTDTLEQAGMVLFKDETHQYLFTVSTDGIQRYITVDKVSRQGIETLARNPLTEPYTSITLKILSDGKHYAFHYATKPTYWHTLAEGIDAAHLSTARAGGFTGSLIGLYATNK